MHAEPYWTLAQGAHFLRLGSVKAADELARPNSIDTLKSELSKSRSGYRVRRTRVHSYDEPRPEFEFVPTGADPDRTQMADFFRIAVGNRCVSGRGFDVMRNEYWNIAWEEVSDLTFQVHPDDPSKSFGFWSESTGNPRYLNPLFCRADLIKLTQPPRQNSTNKTVERILVFLMSITENERLTKGGALTRCQREAYFSYSGFRQAWKFLPDARKYVRGRPQLVSRAGGQKPATN